jgi:tRNA dimethylallyltransferase
MDVGTAKPDAAMRARVRHHMLDLVEPRERYDVQRFLTELRAVLAGLGARGVRPLLVGGTAFYLKCLLQGLFEGPAADLELRARLAAELEREGPEAAHARLAAVDPASAARIHPRDRRRVLRALEVREATGRALSVWQREWGWHGEAASARPARIAGLEVAPPELAGRIARRTRAMLDAGWPEEVAAIRAAGGFGPTAGQALGYREVGALLDGELSREECEERIALRTRQFARRQRTWYRKFPSIRWLAGAAPADERIVGELCAALGG